MENQFLQSLETYESKVDQLLEELDKASAKLDFTRAEMLTKEIEETLRDMKMDTIQVRTVQ